MASITEQGVVPDQSVSSPEIAGRGPPPDPGIEEDLHADPQATGEAATVDSVDSALEAASRWRTADSLETLRRQINEAFPDRDKASDGTLGDARHRKLRSDHNPNINDNGTGVVTAFDITHDPAHGCDAARIVAALYASRDPRIKYLIWNRRIANASPIGAAPAWAWRAYTGSNPHVRHCHVSVKRAKAYYDDAAPWPIASPQEAMTEAAGMAAATEESGALVDIEMALATLAGANGKPLLQALHDTRDAVSALLSRYAEETRRGHQVSNLESRPDVKLLSAGYRTLFDTCRINPSRKDEVAWHRSRLLKGRARYQEVAALTGVPWWFVGIVHALESGFDFAGHLHNGDPLSARTHQAPKGRPLQWNPPNDWLSSALDAIRYKGYDRAADWSLPHALYRFESYNGFGYRGRNVNSPYLWSFSGHYARGKFISDGKFSASAVSRQCGAAVMLKALLEARDVQLDE